MHERRVTQARSFRLPRPFSPWLAPLLAVTTYGPAASALDFAWDVPEGCPSAAFVEQEVTRIVGRPWAELGGDRREARASIAAEARGFRLRLRVITQQGTSSERNIAAASCTEATEAAVAILTAGMAPGVGTGSGAATTDAGQGGSAAAVVVSVPSPASEASSRPAGTELSSDPGSPGAGDGAWRVQPVIGASLGVDWGTLAALAPFARVRVGVEIEQFTVLGFGGAIGRVVGEVDGSGAGAQMYMLMAGLSGCYRLERGHWGASGCGGIELGSLEASGFGTPDERDGSAFWSAALAELALNWRVTDAGLLSLGLSGLVPFRRLQVLMPPAEVHRSAAISLRPWLGLEMQFR
jgi:hypothetical protein